jgi:hypothetical protein
MSVHNLFSEDMIDHDEVRRRIPGRNDEDYDVFKCSPCDTVYLIDYEDDTIFIDPSDYSKQLSYHRFCCPRCGWQLGNGDIILDPKADAKFRPTAAEVRDSPWAWIVKAVR